MNSRFGWLLSGPVPSYDSQKISMACNLIETMESEELNKVLPRFWDIDVIGVTARDHSIDKTLNDFQESVKYNHSDGRYIVRLPWKQNKHELPDNCHLSKTRLISLIKILENKDSGLFMKYDSQIRDKIKLDFIEVFKNPKTYRGICYFIPHFPVFKTDPNATTKMRIVYDASAKTFPNALCLNDSLETGPNLLQQIPATILAFRAHPIAFSADIEKAFLQKELDEADRDATRFLWLKDAQRRANEDNLQVFRFKRALFGASPSPFLLEGTIQHHLKLRKNWVAQDLIGTIYMDNVLSGTTSTNTAQDYYRTSRKIIEEAGMNLRQWTTNSKDFKRQIDKDGTGAPAIVKISGLVWNSEYDKLKLSLDKIKQKTQVR